MRISEGLVCDGARPLGTSARILSMHAGSSMTSAYRACTTQEAMQSLRTGHHGHARNHGDAVDRATSVHGGEPGFFFFFFSLGACRAAVFSPAPPHLNGLQVADDCVAEEGLELPQFISADLRLHFL